MVGSAGSISRRRAVIAGVLGHLGEIQMNDEMTFVIGVAGAAILGAIVAFYCGISHAQTNIAEEFRLVGATRIDGTVFMCNKVNPDH